MTVYIEYAFLQNFFLDGSLLWLSGRCAKFPRSWRRLFLAATVGGAYAVVAPLLLLPKFWEEVLKWAVGLCLPLLAVERVQTRKEWGRYAWNVALFLGLTFLFGGTMLGVTQPSRSLPFYAVLAFFVALTLLALLFVEKFYQKRSVERQIYACKAIFEEKRLSLRGFYDSGNLATKGGIPVCFLSADAFYDLFGDTLLSGIGGQVRDELAVTTLTGEKTLSVCRGELQIELGSGETLFKEVYFACSANMIAREYQILLNARLLGEG